MQQNNVYNPFSDETKAMIHEMGNVCSSFAKTIPKVQCSQCLLYWNQGVIYCTCGHLLVESESSLNFIQWRLDALSIPHYVIKKGGPTVLGTAKPKNKQSTIWPGMRGRDAAKELTLKANILQAQLTIGWNGRTGKTKSLVSSLCRGIQKIPRTMVSHFE